MGKIDFESMGVPKELEQIFEGTLREDFSKFPTKLALAESSNLLVEGQGHYRRFISLDLIDKIQVALNNARELATNYDIDDINYQYGSIKNRIDKNPLTPKLFM